MSDNSDNNSNSSGNFRPSELIYTPTQSAKFALDAIVEIRKNRGRGVPLGINGIDGTFAPVMPGQICAVIGQTSHYKSGFLHFVERNLARTILNTPERKDEIVVHVSVEEGVEEQENLELAHISGYSAGRIMTGDVEEQDGEIQRAAQQIAVLPIYRIGDSQARRDVDVPLHVSNIRRTLDYLIHDMLDWQPRVAAIFVDFLQKLPIDTTEVAQTGLGEQRRLQVMSDVRRLRKMAQKYDCPVFVAVQAKQELKYARPPVMIPSIYDGEESSAIAQFCDRVITLWLPARTCAPGDELKIDGRVYAWDDRSLWIKIAKQRGGFVGVRTYPCVVDFIHNTIRIDPAFYKMV